MKKTLHIIFFFSVTFLTCFSFAQIPENKAKAEDKNYNWGVGVQANTVDKIPGHNIYADVFAGAFSFNNEKDKSYSIGLLMYYFIKQDISFRLRLGLTKRNIYETYDSTGFAGAQSGNYTDNYNSITESNFYMSPGVQWNSKKDKLNFFGGLEIPLQRIGNINYYGISHNYVNYTLTDTFINNTTLDGGYSYGLGTFAGIGITPFKNISICSEFSLAYVYYRYGGNYNTTLIQTGTTNSMLNSYAKGSFATFGILDVKGSIGIFYWF